MTQVLDKSIEQAKSEFERLFMQYDYSFKVADVVKGTIIKRENDHFLVDIGSKTEAKLPFRELSNVEFKDAEDVIKVGASAEFYILKEANDHGELSVSLKRVAYAQNWNKLEDIKRNNENITARIISLVKGGVVVEACGLRGFVPSSQLRTGLPHDGLINQEIEVKVLETDAKKNKLILSQRQALAEQRDQIVGNIIKNLEVDQVVAGEVVRIADFGVFIDINGVDGLLPISEISWQRIKHPSDVVKLGEKIEVKILKIDEDTKRISLSLKRMGENPWTKIQDQFQEGQVIKGSVNKITSFGAFINIFPGVEALLPVAEMSDNNVNPFDVLNVGDELDVLIKKFTPEEHRIGLSIKDIKK